MFGRKINNAENQLAFIEFLRLIVEGVISPEDAVRAYHGTLDRLGIRPRRSLEDDLRLETSVMSYSGSSVSMPRAFARPAKVKPAAQASGHDCGCKSKSEACRVQGRTRLFLPRTAESRIERPRPLVRPTTPDFSKMTRAEKLAYNKARRDRIFGARHRGVVRKRRLRTWQTACNHRLLRAIMSSSDPITMVATMFIRFLLRSLCRYGRVIAVSLDHS